MLPLALIVTFFITCIALQPGELQALQDIYSNVHLNESQAYISACTTESAGVCWFSNEDPCCNGNDSCVWIGIACSISGSIMNLDISSYGLQAEVRTFPFSIL